MNSYGTARCNEHVTSASRRAVTTTFVSLLRLPREMFPRRLQIFSPTYNVYLVRDNCMSTYKRATRRATLSNLLPVDVVQLQWLYTLVCFSDCVRKFTCFATRCYYTTRPYRLRLVQLHRAKFSYVFTIYANSRSNDVTMYYII